MEKTGDQDWDCIVESLPRLKYTPGYRKAIILGQKRYIERMREEISQLREAIKGILEHSKKWPQKEGESKMKEG